MNLEEFLITNDLFCDNFDATTKFIKALMKDIEKDNENKKFECSYNKKQDEQHFCKDCKWCDCKNETILFCKNKKWNPNGESTIVRGNDFCSYWEKNDNENKKEDKIVLTKAEKGLLACFRELGYYAVTKVFPLNGSFLRIYFSMYGEPEISDKSSSIEFDKYKKELNFDNLTPLVSYKIDDLLKG